MSEVSTPTDHQALADTAAYAQELKQAGIDEDVIDAAGYGFIRGRMVTAEQLEATARSIYAQIVSYGEETDWDGEMIPEHSKQYWRRIAALVLRAAGFTVVDPPP